jgi:8-hydroxy-5-deazaflavin:NADPH oxidoreductase
MKIGIIGAGNIGVGLGKRLAAKGHDIVVSFSRTPAGVADAAQKIGGGARPATPQVAASHGDVVIIATPWAVTLQAVGSIAAELQGKIVWDTTNPLKADMRGLEIGLSTSAGEEIARLAIGAKVVKAIPPFAEVLHSSSTHINGMPPSVFVCGDDVDARASVLQLVSDVDADGVESGPLSLARYAEPFGMLLVQLAYVNGFGGRIGAAFIRDRANGGN